MLHRNDRARRRLAEEIAESQTALAAERQSLVAMQV
jgi:hypothetical protein